MTGTSLSLRQQCMEIKWPQIRSSDSTDHYFSLFIAPITPDRPAHHNFQGFCKIDTSLNFGACASGLRGILASSQLAAQTKIGAFQRIQPFSSFFSDLVFWNSVSQQSIYQAVKKMVSRVCFVKLRGIALHVYCRTFQEHAEPLRNLCVHNQNWIYRVTPPPKKNS